MPVVALATGCLMVSRLPYRRLQGYLQGRKPFHQLIIVVLLLAVFWSYKAYTLFSLISCYVLSAPIVYVLKRITSAPRQTVAGDEPNVNVRNHARRPSEPRPPRSGLAFGRT